MLGTANGLPKIAAGSLLQMKLHGEVADDAEDAEKEYPDDARVLRAPQSPPRLRLRVVAPFPLFLGWHCHGAPACSTDRFLGNPSCGTPRTFQPKTSVHVYEAFDGTWTRRKLGHAFRECLSREHLHMPTGKERPAGPVGFRGALARRLKVPTVKVIGTAAPRKGTSPPAPLRRLRDPPA